jgi:hypothetical protein
MVIDDDVVSHAIGQSTHETTTDFQNGWFSNMLLGVELIVSFLMWLTTFIKSIYT